MKKQASRLSRIINVLVDISYVSIMIFVVQIIYLLSGGNNEMISILLSMTTFIMYFFLSELFFNKTIGKFITNTKVQIYKDNKSRGQHILERTILRMIPFEAFTFLRPSGVGLHDSWSNTRVVQDKQDLWKNSSILAKLSRIAVIGLIILFGFASEAVIKIASFSNPYETDEPVSESLGAESPWTEHYLSQDKFSISLPSEPKFTTGSFKFNAEIYDLDTYLADDTSSGLYEVRYASLRGVRGQYLEEMKKGPDCTDNPALCFIRTTDESISKLIIQDVYKSYFEQNPGSRELSTDQVSESEIQFLWKDTSTDTFLQGKIVLFNEDLYVLSMINTENIFPGKDRFFSSLQSFGDLST